MCTVSAAHLGSSVVVTMNRDEQRHRVEGELFENSTLSYPTDLLSGGTWCGVNRHGIAICLLNRYDVVLSTEKNIQSRGIIIPGALEHASASQASDYVSNLEFDQFNGFRLLIFSIEASFEHNWNRKNHTATTIANINQLFASSSSVRSTEIPQLREKRYRQWQQTQGEFYAHWTHGHVPDIHLHETAVPQEESIFMQRADTHTKSVCQMSVGKNQASLHYWPCQNGWEPSNGNRWNSGELLAATLTR